MAGEEFAEAFARVEPLLRAGLEWEGTVYAAEQRVRDESKPACGRILLDARLMLIAASAHAMAGRSGQAAPAKEGVNADDVAHQLLLLASFFQGADATERLVMEGQYVKAAAALKQDLELLARVGEVVAGAAKVGIQPNVKYAPSVKSYYGPLNDVAHPSNPELLERLLDQAAVAGGAGVSPVPVCVPETVLALYELHVFLLVELSRELMRLMREMYGDHDELAQSAELWVAATTQLEAAGHIKRDPETP